MVYTVNSSFVSLKAFLHLIYSLPTLQITRAPQLRVLGQSPGAGLMKSATATPLLTKPLCSQLCLAFVRLPEFYFTIKKNS